MRILITGASGLLGLNLALEARREHQVYGVVHRHAITTQAFEVIHEDLLAPGALEHILEKVQPDWVLHCAALAELDACESDPLLAEQLNTQLPGKLAQLVARGGARLVHISTDAVFDGLRGGYTETDQPNPQSVYARTKLAGEQAVVENDPQAIIARINIYGWSLTMKRSLAEFFFYNLRAGREVPGFTDVYFCPLLVNDLARILLRMLEMSLHGLYHVVSGQSASKYEFGVSIARKFGLDEALVKPSSVSQAGLKAARSPRLTLSVEKLAAALGETPPGLEPGLERFYRLYQDGYPQKIHDMLQDELTQE
jgi:dTDP-4-dehydrorhamnose reductase